MLSRQRDWPSAACARRCMTPMPSAASGPMRSTSAPGCAARHQRHPGRAGPAAGGRSARGRRGARPRRDRRPAIRPTGWPTTRPRSGRRRAVAAPGACSAPTWSTSTTLPSRPACPSTGPVVAVCHSCVATWWEAVRHDPCRRTSAGARDLVGRGSRGRRAGRPEPGLRRRHAARYGLAGRRRGANGRAPASRARAGSAGPTRLHGRAALGRGQERRDAGPRRGAARLPVEAAGPLARAERRAIALRACPCRSGTLARPPAGALGGAADLCRRPPSTSPSAWRCSKPRRPAARWCLSDIPSFRELWGGCGDLFVAATTSRPSRPRSTRLLARRRSQRRTRAGRPGHAQRYTVEAMVAACERPIGGARRRRRTARVAA